MKNLILLLSIITICYSCQKETKNEPVQQKPIITDVQYYGWIKYTQDSMGITNGYNSGSATLYLVDSIGNTATTTYIYSDNITYNPPNSIGACHIHINKTVKSNQSTTHWLKYYIQLINFSQSGSRIFTVYKKYTFQPGNNGYVNFNTLP